MRRTLGYFAAIAWLIGATTSVSAGEGQRAAWTTRAPLPESRTEVSAASDGQRIFVAGGYAPGLYLPRALYVYDGKSDRWSAPGEIPEGINHAPIVQLGGRIYIVGGWRGANRNPTGAVQIYDIASGRWSAGAPMPTPRAAHALAVLGGRIHALGGHADDAQQLDAAAHRIGRDGASVGTHEVYDPAANAWTRRAPMPTPRNHHVAVAVDGQIHTIGGRVGQDFTMTTHEVYDPAADTWRAGPPLPTGRSGIAAVALDGRIYVFGGETLSPVHKTFSEAERFDPRTGKWEAMPPMPTPRHGLGAAVLGNAIHVISGGPQPGAAFSGVHEVLTPGR